MVLVILCPLVFVGRSLVQMFAPVCASWHRAPLRGLFIARGRTLHHIVLGSRVSRTPRWLVSQPLRRRALAEVVQVHDIV